MKKSVLILCTGNSASRRRGPRAYPAELEKVPYLDSCALGQLMSTQVRANKKGAALKLVGLKRVFSNMLAMMKLTEVFEIYERQADAIASF